MMSNFITCSFDRLGLSGSVTHGIKKCEEYDNCFELSEKAKQWMKSYDERLAELLNDKYDLKDTNKESYNNHITEIYNAQGHVYRCMAILAEKIEKGECGGRNYIITFIPKKVPTYLTTDELPFWAQGGIVVDNFIDGTATVLTVGGGTLLAVVTAGQILPVLIESLNIGGASLLVIPAL